MKKRILSLCLLCFLLLAGIRAPVLATPSTYNVSTLEELRNACSIDNAYVILNADIDGYGENFLLDITGNGVTLDMNGHYLNNILTPGASTYGGVIKVLSSNVTIQNGVIDGHSVYCIGIIAWSEAKNLTVRNMTNTGNIGSFVFSITEVGGVHTIENCSMTIAERSQYAAIFGYGSHTIVVDQVDILQGGNNSGGGNLPNSIYAAIEARTGTSLTLLNVDINKRVNGKIVTIQDTSYSTFGSLMAPDAQIELDRVHISRSDQLTTTTSGNYTFKEIIGSDFTVTTEMKVITSVDCTIQVPVTGAAPDYNPVCNSNLYYLASNSGGNMLNSTSWQVNTDGIWDMNAVKPGDHFEALKTYRVLFDVTAKDGYFFANDIVGTINGEVPDDYWVGGAKTTYRIIKWFPATKTGWCKIDGKWYYYDSNGSLHIGWLKLNGKYYYMNSSGVMMTGWQKVGGKWYYMNSSGVMLTSWQKIGGKWYYLESNGAMVTGWKKLGGVWYYFNSSGVMVTGWQEISGKTYYFKSSGAMAANEWCNGWWLNADGTWTYKYKASWKQNSKGWWFGDTSGWYAKSTTITIDGKQYTFNAAGYWVQ